MMAPAMRYIPTMRRTNRATSRSRRQTELIHLRSSSAATSPTPLATAPKPGPGAVAVAGYPPIPAQVALLSASQRQGCPDTSPSTWVTCVFRNMFIQSQHSRRRFSHLLRPMIAWTATFTRYLAPSHSIDPHPPTGGQWEILAQTIDAGAAVRSRSVQCYHSRPSSSSA